MSSDGGGGGGAGADAPVGRPGGYFDYGDVEFEAAQAPGGAVAAIDFAADEILSGRKKNPDEVTNLTQTVAQVQEKFNLDREQARSITKEANRVVATPPVATVAGVPVTERNMLTGALEPIPGISRVGEALFWAAWDAGWEVGPADPGQGFDASGMPDLPGVESAGPGPDLVTPDVTVDAGTTDGGTTTDAGGGLTPAPQQTPPTTPIAAVGAATSRARRRCRTATVATSTLGVTTAAPVARKTLLGA